MANFKSARYLELKGSYRHNPARRRPPEVQDPRPLGDPPARLPAEVLPFWDEIVAMAPPGLLGRADRWAVELAARTMRRALTGEASATELSVLRSLLGALGLTPSDRLKLPARQEKPRNKFTDLANQIQGVQ